MLWSSGVPALFFSTTWQMCVAFGALCHTVIYLVKMLSVEAWVEVRVSESILCIRRPSDWYMRSDVCLVSPSWPLNIQDSVLLQRQVVSGFLQINVDCQLGCDEHCLPCTHLITVFLLIKKVFYQEIGHKKSSLCNLGKHKALQLVCCFGKLK